MPNVQPFTRKAAKIHAGIMALVFGLVGGLMVFIMTIWLLIKGGPNVGAHLRLLSQYFIGYSVTWCGSVIGFMWGALVGALTGAMIGWIYNFVAAWRDRKKSTD
jgi:hypothetical protein